MPPLNEGVTAIESDPKRVAARLNVSVPGLDQEVKQQLVDDAHQTCPCSRMTRGDVVVQIKLV